MRKFFVALCTITALALAFNSCKKDNPGKEEKPEVVETTLSANPTEVVFECDGGSQNVAVTSNSAWTASSGESWCTVTASGNGNGTLAISAATYDGTDDRSTTVTIKAGDKTATVKVSQKFKETISVTKTSHEMGWEGGDITVEVKSNIAYDVTIGEGCEEWIHAAEASKALESSNAVIKIDPNMTFKPREGYVVIAAKGNPEKLATRVVISQEARPETRVTEDFESYDSWAQAIEGWTFVDMDGEGAGQFQKEIPFITEGGTKTSWFVFTDIFDGQGASHSGEHHLAAIFNSSAKQNDDWLISPRLTGTAQTISFWGRAFIDSYGQESIELLYSKTDTNVESFTSVRVENYSAVWTETTFDIPEGALYFAIRYISQYIAMVFIDDITYSPDPSVVPASVAKPCATAARPANRPAAGFSRASIRKAGR